MNRVYVLINTSEGKAERVASVLRKKDGVLAADLTDRPPDIIMVMQAFDRERLTRLIISALALVENDIKGMQILPVMNVGTSSAVTAVSQSICSN